LADYDLRVMSSEPNLETREGRLEALHSVGVLTDHEYEFAMREGLDINQNIPLAMAAAERREQGQTE
jgi:hypothetical protein